MDFLSRIDCPISVYKEKIADNGEDAYLYSLNGIGALVGVFDGCGGAGAKRYSKLQGKTGAYIASRTVAGTVRDWFQNSCGMEIDSSARSIQAEIAKNFHMCEQVGGESSKLVSTMSKTFPTTAAFAICSENQKQIQVDFFWAGDSRVYVLDKDGLAQLSVDDLTVPDAMENLYNDGVMTNVVSKSKEYTLHHGSVLLSKPGIVFAATDGCFGYLHSPMEFEYLLLSNLMAASSIADWERKLDTAMGRVAGDDYTMSGIIVDYGNFEAMKSSFASRVNNLYKQGISRAEHGDREELTVLWNKYKSNYYRFQKTA